MNSTAFWVIVLGFWIYFLQNRVKDLEKVIGELKEQLNGVLNESRVRHTPEIESEQEKVELSSVYDKENNVVVEKPMLQKSGEPISAVESFKEQYEEPEVEIVPEPVETVSQIIEERTEPEVQKEPSWLMTLLVNYFTGGNLLVRIGGVVLFFGLAFLVKYAADHSMLSIELRLVSVAVGAVAMIIVGWRLREREGAYGQVLQGLGIAMLYLVIFGAAKFYTLFSLETAFVMMLGVVLVGSLLAVKEDALPLALFATAGGFLVPILTSSGEGSHIILFSYYALLNLGVFSVAWYRSWRVLNIVGFLFTFVIAAMWGVLRYSPDIFASTEPFFILFFVMYLTISILFTLKHPYEPKNLVDGTLVFGLPVVAFPLQLKLVEGFAYGDAVSAVVLGVLYVGLWYLLRGKERTVLLSQSFLALGVVFFTIAVPYIFDADVSAALWALESAGIVWIALKQEKPLTRYFGEGLLFVSILLYPVSVLGSGVSGAEYLGFLILIVAVLTTSYLLDSYRSKLLLVDRIYTVILMSISVVLWFISTPTQLESLELSVGNLLTVTLILYVPVLAFSAHYLKWKLPLVSLQGYIPLGVLFALVSFVEVSHPFEGFNALSLALFMTLGYLMLYRYHSLWRLAKYLHTMMLWLIVLVLILELHYLGSLLIRTELISVAVYLGYLVVIAGTVGMAYWLQKHAKGIFEAEGYLPPLFLGLAILLWMVGTSGQLTRFAMMEHYTLLSSFITGGMLLFVLGRWVLWKMPDQALQGYFVVGAFLAFMAMTRVDHPFEGIGWLVLGTFGVTHYLYLRYFDTQWGLQKEWHLLSFWFGVFVLSMEWIYHTELWVIGVISHFDEVLIISMAVVPLAISLLALLPKRYPDWLEPYREAYQFIGVGGLLVILVLWEWRVFGTAVMLPNIPYLPLLNPLDLMQIAVVGILLYWLYRHKEHFSNEVQIWLYGTVAFISALLVSVIFARAVHHLREVAYDFGTLWGDLYFQAGLSILWSVVAIVAMILSKHYTNRPLWMAGFGVLITVVLKLFIVELANSGTVERIVSFIVVGILLLVIGYFVPLPPNDEQKKKD